MRIQEWQVHTVGRNSSSTHFANVRGILRLLHKCSDIYDVLYRRVVSRTSRLNARSCSLTPIQISMCSINRGGMLTLLETRISTAMHTPRAAHRCVGSRALQPRVYTTVLEAERLTARDHIEGLRYDTYTSVHTWQLRMVNLVTR